jgi:hypothetical protein
MVFDSKAEIERWEIFRQKANQKAKREKQKYKPADNPEKLCAILFAIDERGGKHSKFKTASLREWCGMSSQEIGHYMPVLVDKGFISVFTRAESCTYQKEFEGKELENLISERVGFHLKEG